MHTTEHDVELTTEIAHAVAETVGVDPLELEPLYDAVDPEMIENLLETPDVSEESSVTFEYAGLQVTVEGEGTVRVEDSDVAAE